MSGQPRYIFSINPGRSGSHYLCTLLNCIDSISAHHEPDPNCQRAALFDWMRGKREPMETQWNAKSDFMFDRLQTHSTYAETSNAFVKGFGWVAAQELEQTRLLVIHLTRKRSDVIRSLKRRHFFPAHESKTTYWMGSPIRTGDNHGDIVAYLEWFDSLASIWKSVHPNIRTVPVRLDQLQSMASVMAFLEECEITTTQRDLQRLAATIGKPTNH